MKSLALLLPFAALTAPVVAQDVLGIAWSGEVYDIDLATGDASSRGHCGYSRINAMAKAPDGTLFAMSDSDLISIDPATGLAAFVTTTGLTSVRGLAISEASTLYAIESTLAEDLLYTIDVVSGATTFIGATGYLGIQGLTFAGGALFGFEVGSGAGFGDGLITIDPATGAATDVNAAVGGRGTEGQCLFSDATGELYCANTELYSIDAATGMTTLIGGGTFSVRGAEIVGVGPMISVTNLVGGQVATLSVTAAPPFGVAYAGYSLQGGGPSTLVTTLGSFEVDLSAPIRRLSPLSCDRNGQASLSSQIPAAATGVSVWFQALVLDASGSQARVTNSLALVVQ